MAKKNADGLRGLVARSTDRRRKGPKKAQAVLDGLKKLVSEVEDRATGGPEKRRLAAKKGVATRRRKARARSEAAKKGARTRARARS